MTFPHDRGSTHTMGIPTLFYSAEQNNVVTLFPFADLGAFTLKWRGVFQAIKLN